LFTSILIWEKGAPVLEAGNFNNREPLFIFHHINNIGKWKIDLHSRPIRLYWGIASHSNTTYPSVPSRELSSHSHLLALTEPHLIQEAENKFAVLENVLGVNVIDSVVCGVNIWVAVLECRLEDEASRESAPGSRAVVRASISAGALDVCDVGVLRANVSGVIRRKCRGDNIPGQSHERGRRSSLR
jgi:hypothetical protein